MSVRSRSTRLTDAPAPWRWLLTYGLLLSVPLGEGLTRPGFEPRGIGVAVACVTVAVTLALFAGSRIAWTYLTAVELGAVVLAAIEPGIFLLLAAMRLLLLTASPIRVYVWRPGSGPPG